MLFGPFQENDKLVTRLREEFEQKAQGKIALLTFAAELNAVHF